MKKLINSLLLACLLLAASACNDKESYADLLRDENYAVNAYLVNYPVITNVPADSVFVSTADILADPDFLAEFGAECKDETELREVAISHTPFYRMDDDGYLYMQVIDPGKGAKATYDQTIWFRFTRYNLKFVYQLGTWDASGNEQDVASQPTSFRYQNKTLSSTSLWGTGIQTPLNYLPLNCHVRIIIKSYLGPTQEVSSVYPYLYNIRYYPSKI